MTLRRAEIEELIWMLSFQFKSEFQMIFFFIGIKEQN